MPEEAARLGPRIAAALPSSGSPAVQGWRAHLPLRDLASGGFVADAAGLAGRSVLVRTRDPLAAVAALTSLDGIASRLVLCPPDVAASRLGAVIAAACVEGMASDMDGGDTPYLPVHPISLEPLGERPRDQAACDTEWALFTSGTSGDPKMVGHTLAALTGAIPSPAAPDAPRPVWATFYDPRRYGGLQMLLRALLGGFDLMIGDAGEPLADYLRRIGGAGATHVAGTPSHWRRVLMTPANTALDPGYVRLSGEIADQPVLDALRARFPRAVVTHAYASTEAGVGFEVGDGLAGFPASLLERTDAPVQMRVVDEVLQLRSTRAARGYVGQGAATLADADGWVDSGDRVERHGERYYFLGRRSGAINVGGLKVGPEEVEAVVNACPGVRMSRVAARANPLLGALVSAEVVLDDAADAETVRAAVMQRCRAELPPHKRPATVKVVEALPIGPSGKLERRGA